MSRIMLKTISIFAVLMMAPLAVSAANNDDNNYKDFNYNYVEGGFVNIDSGTGNPYGGIGNLSGVGADGSFEVAPRFRLLAGFNTASCCSYRLNNFSVGVGYHQMLLQRVGLFINGELVNSHVKYSPSGYSNSDSGLRFTGGVRFVPVDKVEVDGFVSITSGNDYIDSSPSPGVLGMYNFADHWNVFASYTANTDLFYTGVRYDF